jgi:hypothetical protein
MHPTASKAIITTTSDFAPGVYADPEIQTYADPARSATGTTIDRVDESDSE